MARPFRQQVAAARHRGRHHTDLLQEARARIDRHPELYVPKIYGETEVGGTQVLYLTAANVTFEQLGLPTLKERSAAQFSESVSHAP